MIIVRSPLRISIAGGATDLKSFYSKYDGYCISAAIDKYVYTMINTPLENKINLKYSKIENVHTLEDIDNPIIRETLRLFDINDKIEIITSADAPASSGLGGSSSFTCSLIKGLAEYNKRHISAKEIAETACDVEIKKLKGNLGKQDQFISAYGGLKEFEFYANENVIVKSLYMEPDKLLELQNSMLLFFTGYFHNTNTVLFDQVKKTLDDDKEMIDNLIKTKRMAVTTKELLQSGDIKGYGELTHEHWINKKKRSPNMSNQKIDYWYEEALKNGAIGGKLVGAGGAGGFLMFIADDVKKLRNKMKSLGLEELRFNFDFEGTKRLILI